MNFYTHLYNAIAIETIVYLYIELQNSQALLFGQSPVETVDVK